MWKVNKEDTNSIQCSLVKSPTVYIDPIPRSKIQYLMNEYPHQEWIAYLQGRMFEKDSIYVEDISVPPHKDSSGGSAEAEPFHIPGNCVGIIHSHHKMGAYHSATDKAYVDKNYPVSITVAHGKQGFSYDAISYQTTLCGKGAVVKCLVKYVSPEPLFNKEEFLKRAKENIDKGKKVYMMPLSLGDYVIDGKGNVLSQKELEAITRSIWNDDEFDEYE